MLAAKSPLSKRPFTASSVVDQDQLALDHYQLQQSTHHDDFHRRAMKLHNLPGHALAMSQHDHKCYKLNSIRPSIIHSLHVAYASI
jgi:hypothetical protein